jgi:hypothetical protein
VLIADFKFWIEKQQGSRRGEESDILLRYVDRLLAAFPRPNRS